MIIEYHRPKTLNEALTLLSRQTPQSYPLGGGTVLNQGLAHDYAVVDLQDLGLNKIASKGNLLLVGATVTLQDLLSFDGLSSDLVKVINLETTYNLRQMATIAGTIVTATGRSPLATMLLAMDANIEIHAPEDNIKVMKVGNWLPLRSKRAHHEVITSVELPNHTRMAYEYIARTPVDQPIICAAVSQWNSGRTRLALGGWGDAPILAMDGPIPDGVEIAAKQATSNATDDWASAEYRSEMAGVLSRRCIDRLAQ